MDTSTSFSSSSTNPQHPMSSPSTDNRAVGSQSTLSSAQFPASSTPSTPQKSRADMSSPPATIKPLSISNLMSPPEQSPFESFHLSTPSAPNRSMPESKRPSPTVPLSPPISPFTKNTHSVASSPGVTSAVRDPVLYPGGDLDSSPPRPLFGTVATTVDARIDQHVAARAAGDFFLRASPPARDEYELALRFQGRIKFKSRVMELYLEDRNGWLRHNHAQLVADKKAVIERNIKMRQQQQRQQKQSVGASLAVKKPLPALRPIASKVAKVDKPRRSPTRRLAPQIANGSRQRTAPARGPSVTPEPRVRTAAPTREDRDWRLRPDYCPPLDTLPNKPNSLKVDWKTSPSDLSNDPDREHLHPDELVLAASLRLNCAQYLTSKRRLFERRFECARIGKEFRKTDAQQACKIDVNKASKLWTAFEKVGWLDIKHTQRFLSP